ncbi:MAG TPA: sn-glycerol-3-phosphate ABC transporter ATP-binding protein UgpC [Chloroflexota bacterium]|nr:sn-glycerol-3-phosphate ABC transporter ATP-binding protein UgpC [Chloroflexota bacterium]
MSTVSCRDVTKRFGEVVAVNRVNLDVADGEFVVFVGPSGCGKTTTLRMIAGLESISEGQIRLDDKIVNRVPPRHRDLAMVFQNYALYPHMRVFDNIAYSLRLRHIANEEIQRRVNEVAELLGIGALLERSPGQLSGGQRQRVALGRAIVRHPSGFLMDEPLSNLDAQLRVQMRREIIRLQRQLGTTTIYVTHDQVEAMTMGDRIVVMRDGLVQQIGPPDEVYRRPRTAFVGRFIGSPAMNMSEGTLVSRGSRLFLEAAGTAIGLPDVTQAAITRGAPLESTTVTWGIRPEDLTVMAATSTDNGWLPGVVDLVEHLGADAYASVRVGEDVFVARVSPDTRLADDQKVALSVNADKLHLFDRATGDTLLV